MDNTQPPITLDEAIYLKDKLNDLFFPNDPSSKKVVYDSKEVQQFLGIVNSKRVGIPKGTTPKEIGIKLEQWLEFLQQGGTTTTELPQYEAQTTTTGLDLETKVENAEKLRQKNEAIRAREKLAVEEFEKRGKEIYAEQQKLKVQIDKLKASQPELEGKRIFADLTIPEPPFLDKTEQADYETLKIKAQSDPVGLVGDLAEQIEALTREEFKELPEKERELIAKYHAAVIVEKIVKPESIRTDLPSITQLAILRTVINDKDIVPSTINSKDAHKAVVHSSKILYNTDYNSLLSRSLATAVMGPKFTTVAFGPDIDEIEVRLSSQKREGSIPLEFGKINSDATTKEESHYQALESFRNISSNQASTYVFSITSKAIESKVAALPANSKLKAIYNIPGVKDILSKYGLASSVEWQAYTKFGSTVLKYYPEASPYLSLFGQFTGISVGITTASRVVPLTFGAGIPSVITTIQPITWKGVPYTYGIATGKKFVFGKVAGQAVQTGVKVGFFAKAVGWVAKAFGIVSGLASFGIGTAVTLVGEQILKRVNWPAVKKWFQENGPVLAVMAGFGGLALGGPAVGGLVLFGGLAATGSLTAFATGAFGVLGLIGRSVGIAIATPVIVTLLVLPPLVAFIMLVINNSAYVVPPKPVAESGFESGFGPFACTTEKTPTSITSSVNSPIATRAWEIMEDMYQGFWCFWNRSPGDLATDTTDYPPSYPELFNEKLFASNPNPTRDEVSSCGECLFWCTWLVQKSYKENGYNIQYTLWSPTMYADFNSRGKILATNQETATGIQPGAVVFFDVDNGLNRIDHVGVVHSVNAGGVTFLQSNAGTKDDFIPFGSNGLQDLPGITVVGVGNP